MTISVCLFHILILRHPFDHREATTMKDYILPVIIAVLGSGAFYKETT